MKDLRVVFMGTPDFAVGVLKRMLDEQLNVVGVITAVDKPAGRGRKLRQSAVKEYALQHALTILQPPNLKDPDFHRDLKALNGDLFVVVAFRMLPRVVWEMPKYGTFNLHASLLPDYRGAAPINWVLINGETETGLTTFFINDQIDCGELLLQERVPIAADETAGSLHDKLMKTGAELVVDTIRLIASGQARSKPQPAIEGLHPAPKLDRENTRIHWDWKADRIDALVRGLNPFPAAWSLLENEGEQIKVKIYGLRVSAHKPAGALPGDIMKTGDSLSVVTGDTLVDIIDLQLAGKRRMPVKDLLNGFRISEGAKFL